MQPPQSKPIYVDVREKCLLLRKWWQLVDTIIAIASAVFSAPSLWIPPVFVMDQIIRFTAEFFTKDSEEAPNQNSLMKQMWQRTQLLGRMVRKPALVALEW